MSIDATNVTDTCGLSLAANQTIFEATDGTDTVHVKITTVTERLTDAIKWTMRSVIIDASGGYVEAGGEPVMLVPSEHTFTLGHADADPVAVKAGNLSDEAVRAFRYFKQLQALA